MVFCGTSWCSVVPHGGLWYLMVCGLTSQGADHGDSCKGAGQPLAAHDGRGVGGGEQACHAEQAALQNRAARWTGEPHRETPD